MIYLDHAATTQPSEEVCKVMQKVQEKNWANPNSTHDFGIKSNLILRTAEHSVSNHINGSKGRIIWTSSGSQANHLVISGICNNEGRHLLTSNIEHKSIECLRQKYGHTCNPYDLDKYINQYTVLVSYMMVNNETGHRFNTKKIAANAAKKKVLFHTDAVQALGKLKIDVEELGCDLVTLSAHKIYGPKGVGCLWIRDGVKINLPYLGTPNVPAIAGFGEAVKNLNVEAYYKELEGKEDHLILELTKHRVDFRYESKFSSSYPRVAGILSIEFPDIDNIELMLELSTKGIMISLGSACNKGTVSSRVLEGMGFTKETIASSVRISLGKHCSIEDLTTAAQIIAETTKELKHGS